MKTNKLIKSVIEKYKKLNPENHGVLLGVSGGVDSVALAFCLSKVCDNLCLGHITHRGMRDDETLDKETELVRDLAKKLNVSFREFEFVIDKKGNEEGNAREQRYKALAGMMYGDVPQEGWFNPDCLMLATAHHADDQLETLIMKLVRGSGITGMTGMKESREVPYAEDQRLTLIRPMLGITKEDCYEICVENGLEWMEDVTNTEDDKDRNFIRLNVIDALKKVNPKASEHASGFASIMQSTEQMLNDKIIRLPSSMWGNKVSRVSADALRLEQDVVICEWIRHACSYVPRSGNYKVDKISKAMMDQVVDAVRKRKTVSFDWPVRTIEVCPEHLTIKSAE